MAGLWDVWHGPPQAGEGGEEGGQGGPLVTFTILTADSSPRLEWLHNRMPLILADEQARQLWLDTGNPSTTL